jgi:hypothetical protein
MAATPPACSALGVDCTSLQVTSRPFRVRGVVVDRPTEVGVHSTPSQRGVHVTPTMLHRMDMAGSWRGVVVPGATLAMRGIAELARQEVAAGQLGGSVTVARRKQRLRCQARSHVDDARGWHVGARSASVDSPRSRLPGPRSVLSTLPPPRRSHATVCLVCLVWQLHGRGANAVAVHVVACCCRRLRTTRCGPTVAVPLAVLATSAARSPHS